MNCLVRGAAGVALLLTSGLALAQDKAPATATHRRLAEGLMQNVDPHKQVEEATSRHDVVELLAFDRGFDWAKDIPFRYDVWALDFKFKPMRMIWVDVPQASGQMQRKLIWYMVYSVTNPGKIIHPTLDENNTYKVELVDRPVRFVPSFLLVNRKSDKAYPDHVIPIAVPAIQAREDRTQQFCNTVDMCREIKVGETVWGVAMWDGALIPGQEGVDPRTDYFSVYVTGLTNAYRWKDETGAYKNGDRIGTGRHLLRKTLKLNFWRAGDEYFLNEKEIRYGIPGELDYEWVWR